jgi:hypothetical protein
VIFLRSVKVDCVGMVGFLQGKRVPHALFQALQIDIELG